DLLVRPAAGVRVAAAPVRGVLAGLLLAVGLHLDPVVALGGDHAGHRPLALLLGLGVVLLLVLLLLGGREPGQARRQQRREQQSRDHVDTSSTGWVLLPE